MLLEDKMEIMAQLKKQSGKYKNNTYNRYYFPKTDDIDMDYSIRDKLFSFGIRLFMALMIFTLYFFMEEKGIEICEVTSGKINEYLVSHFFLP